MLKTQSVVQFPPSRAGYSVEYGHKPVPKINWLLVLPVGILTWVLIALVGYALWQVGTTTLHHILNALYELSEMPLERYHYH